METQVKHITDMKLSTFKPNLLRAFEKMILGKAVSLGPKGVQRCRVEHGDQAVDQDWFIMCIHEDETMDVMSRDQHWYKRVKLSFINT